MENTYQLLWRLSTTLIYFQLKHLLNFIEKRLLGLRTLMVKTRDVEAGAVKAEAQKFYSFRFRLAFWT